MQQYPSTGMESCPSDDNADQDLQNILIELFGPALLLPFDKASWDSAQTSSHSPSPSALDYTYGSLPEDDMDVLNWNVDGGSTQVDPSRESESFSVDPEETSDEFDNLVAQSNTSMSSISFLGVFSASESWDLVMNFSLGFDEKILFEFSHDELDLPVPRKECIVSNTVGTMRHAS